MKEELSMNVEEQLITLIKSVSDVSAKVDSIQDSIKGMPQLLQKHDTRLDQIEGSLKRGATKFDKIESAFEKLEHRVDALEKADGEKAKATVRTVVRYIGVAIIGAIIANIPSIINSLGGQ